MSQMTRKFLDPNQGPLNLKGTATNDDAGVGIIGEYVSSVQSAPVDIGATSVWSNMTSISLTAGDWDVTGQFSLSNNGSTVSIIPYPAFAISVNSGTTTADQVFGDNQLSGLAPTTTSNVTIGTISNYRLSLSGTTTIYLKSLVTYTITTPQWTGRLSARRVR